MISILPKYIQIDKDKSVVHVPTHNFNQSLEDVGVVSQAKTYHKVLVMPSVLLKAVFSSSTLMLTRWWVRLCEDFWPPEFRWYEKQRVLDNYVLLVLRGGYRPPECGDVPSKGSVV